MKRIISVLFAVLLMAVCTTAAFASNSPAFSYNLLLTDSRGEEITNLQDLDAGETVNVAIQLTRTDITEDNYDAYGIEFKVMTKGFTYNKDGAAFREGMRVTSVEYFGKFLTGVTYFDMNREGVTVSNPLEVCSWSYTVKDPAALSLDVTTALVYVTGQEDSFSPVAKFWLTLDAAGGRISGDISGEYEEGSVVTLPSATRSGYTFKGWSDGENTYPAGARYTVTKMVTLQAQWEKDNSGSGSGSGSGGSVVDPTPATMPFVDVPSTAYYHDAVAWAVKMGITNGTTATTFEPNVGCTRAQMVTFLWRANGCPEPAAKVSPFEDVNLNTYYGKAVLWATEQGITVGTTDTTFSPYMNCSRAHMATFLYRMEDGSAKSNSNPFLDVPANAYYTTPVQWAVENGVTNGTTATTYSPQVTCTRAQMVTFLYRLLAE